MMCNAELTLEQLCPFVEDAFRLHAGSNTERHIDVGPAIVHSRRRRARDRAARNANVGLRELNHAPSHTCPVLWSESRPL